MFGKKKSSGARPIASTFQIVEAYKSVRTNLLFALATTESKTVVISSAEPNAGKSTAATNLAITMAQTGAKVLLVDADMRRPSLHRTFHMKKHNGLSIILSGLASFEDCVCREVAKGLDLIPSGTLPPNPSELLGSEAMAKFLQEMEKQYDYVFVDTPPIGVVSDALVTVSRTAGVVLVCRQRQTTYSELQNAIDSVRNVNSTLLGVIIADMKDDNRTYGKYDHRKYYKAYDYSYTNEPADSHK